MKCHCSQITLNGICYGLAEIHDYCRKGMIESTREWERDLYAFILEWLNKKEYIEAKTSGSTGIPKTIRLSKESMISSARLTGRFFNFSPGQTALLCLSPAYIAGKMMIVRAMVWGLNLIAVEPGGNPLDGLEEKIDFAAMVPLQVYNSMRNPSCFDRVNRLIIGGGAVDEALRLRLMNLETECYSTYGMTETVSHVALQRLNGENRKTSFQAMDKIRFNLDERGCLVIHAAHLLEKALVTNDIVELISETEFRWLGRYDNVVNSGGVKLIPEKLEQKIDGIMNVRYFFTGLPDAQLGERLILVVEDEVWGEETMKLFHTNQKELLGKYELPKEIYFVKNFSETATGKVQRSATIAELMKS
jgi:O-succinylbenzoic acid--CoA ligase